MHTYCLSCYWRGDGAGDTVYSKFSKVKIPWLERKWLFLGKRVQWHDWCILVLPIYKATICGKVSCVTENHKKGLLELIDHTIFSVCTTTISRLFWPPEPILSYKPLISV